MNKELKRGIRKRRKLWLIGLAAVSALAVACLMTVIARGSKAALVVYSMLVFFVLCLIWLIGRAKTGRADKPLRDFLYRVQPFEKAGEYPAAFCLPLWVYDGPVDRLKRFEQKGIAVLIDRPKGIYRLITALDEEKQMMLLSDTRESGTVSLSREDPLYQCTLCLIATKVSRQDEKIRGKALKDITDQSILTRLAESEYTEVFDRIADQRVLAGIAGKGKLSAALNAVKAMTDEPLLAEIALKAERKEVRKEAVKAIHDEELLARIAREGDWYLCGGEAVLRIRDQKRLAEIAADRNVEILTRREALNRLEDRELLRLIEVNDDDPVEFRWCVAQKLKDKHLLAEMKDEYEQWEEETAERAKREKLDYLRRTNYPAYLDYLSEVDPDAYHEQTENRV